MGKDSPPLKDVAAFLEAAERGGALERALACLLALNGLSIQAVCDAQVSDLGAGETRTLRVSLTGGPPTPVPLAPRTAHAIDEHLDDRTEGALLMSEDDRPLQSGEAEQIVRRIVRAAGLGHRLERF